MASMETIDYIVKQLLTIESLDMTLVFFGRYHVIINSHRFVVFNPWFLFQTLVSTFKPRFIKNISYEPKTTDLTHLLCITFLA